MSWKIWCCPGIFQLPKTTQYSTKGKGNQLVVHYKRVKVFSLVCLLLFLMKAKVLGNWFSGSHG